MPTSLHDPVLFAAGLSTKLASRSRHVCVFLGAGVSRACGLPDLPQLEAAVLRRLTEPEELLLRRQLEGRDLEEVLSRLRRIAALLIGDQAIDGLTADDASNLDLSVCRAIVYALDLAGVDLTPTLHLAAWAGRGDYRLPVEIFTVNYDLLLEVSMEALKVPYFDGFVGNLRARFHPELVDASSVLAREGLPPSFVRLWKLHGSLNWAWDGSEVVRLGSPVPEGVAAAIYPSDRKYEESRRVPFVVMLDNLSRSLHQPESLMLISGYSFRDEHLNEIIFDAATRRPRSEFVIFFYSDLPEDVAARALRTPNIQLIAGDEAVIGGVRANWCAPAEEHLNVWEGNACVLPDFKHLAAFLGRNATRDYNGGKSLKDLIQSAYESIQRASGGGAENA